MVVPRWGIYEGIKYSPRRCILKICPVCKELFVQYDRGYKIYCSDVCRIKAHKEQKKIIDAKIRAKRDKYEHAQQRRIDYAQKLRSERTWKPGTMTIPKPKVDDEGNVDYEDYHQRLARKLSMTRVK
ncbi:MAG: hypothetical protein K8E24_003125 [Methanobacterium paludis]|nr:hypothetical protein [Methanobacterium paludis]